MHLVVYLVLEYCHKGEIASWSSKTERFSINKEISST